MDLDEKLNSKQLGLHLNSTKAFAPLQLKVIVFDVQDVHKLEKESQCANNRQQTFKAEE